MAQKIIDNDWIGIRSKSLKDKIIEIWEKEKIENPDIKFSDIVRNLLWFGVRNYEKTNN